MNIIVVEDDISINDILTSALRYEGYSVRSAFTSSQGKDLLVSFKPDLILLDINLPDESGYEICKLVTNKSLKVPVIMLTARNDIIDKILGLEMGADDYITKPFNIKEVLTRVKVALRRVDKYKEIEQEVISEIQLKNNISIKSTSRSVFKNDMIADPQFKDRAINRIHSESERLHKLVLDLIATSKGLSSNEESFTKVDISEILIEICDDMNMKARKYSLTINKEIESCQVDIQINRVKSVIVNLIDNAIKYIKNDDVVYVQGLVVEGSYKIIVSNKSEPIPEGIYNHIFEPFIKQSDDDSGSSRGLGLYICKEIITEHNAQISIENGEEVKVTVELNID